MTDACNMNEHSVGIIGAGTMGAGIAQVAAAAGWTVELMDVDPATAEQAIEGIRKRFARLVEKGRMTEADATAAGDRLLVASCGGCIGGCELIIEAIVEDLDVKAKVLGGFLPSLRDDAIIASNTSSLSITDLGERLGVASRVVGMHFFNPAPLMKLVEIIAGADTDPAIADRTAAIATEWGKTVARAADVPGFIVNHVARPYYLEAFRIVEDKVASPAFIDDVCRRLGGFRMGPLELTDLIGQDVNTATTRSVWEALDQPPLLAPSALQESLVKDGHLGRKTGRGVYDHGTDELVEMIGTDIGGFEPSKSLDQAVAAFVAGLTDEDTTWRERYVLARIVAAIMTQAALARDRGVATEEDIDTAMRAGVNYPAGPFEWASRIGEDQWVALLDALDATTHDGRFRLSGAAAS